VADVTILPDGLHVTAAPDETVLRALARAGLRYRVGCKRGGCGICKVQLVLGEVAYERPIAPQVLSDDERVEGVCLSCRAVPLTNVVIELQESDRLRRVLGFAFPTTPTQTTNSTRAAKEGNVDDERRDPAGVRAPAGDRSGRGP
jgi:CDP-4-dehydro-6-deoxyglucose reductase